MSFHESPKTIKVYLEKTYSQLILFGQARLESELLLAHVLNVSRSHLLAWPDQVLSSSEIQQLENLVQRRLLGESIAYLMGEKEFWSLTLEVTKDTLIPRPDTELLVERVLETLDRNPVQTVADLGTGSGAIALSLAKERPHWHILATDLYAATLAVAKRNAHRLQLNTIEFYQGDWFKALPVSGLNAIVSNPPYLAENDPHLAALKFEPLYALVAPQAGLSYLNHIIEHAKDYLTSAGGLFLEHGWDQGEAVQEQMVQCGYEDVVSYRDLSGHPRVTVGKK